MRRLLVSGIITGIITALTAVFSATAAVVAENATSGSESIYSIPIQPMKVEGAATATSLAPYKGKVLLLVNVASKCGYTKQYEGLEALNKKYVDQGLSVLGFPSNDFKGQEPGTEAEIVEFCKSTYNVSFPLFAKVAVKGGDKAPLYKYLTEGDHAGKSEVSWNFNKYLVGRDGAVIAHFDSKVKPDSLELTQAIEKALTDK